MEKHISNCGVVLKPLRETNEIRISNKVPPQYLEFENNVDGGKLENFPSDRKVKDQWVSSDGATNFDTPCIVKLEDMNNSRKQLNNNYENEERCSTNNSGLKGTVSNSVRNPIKPNSRSKESTPILNKTKPNITQEPVTPHAHIEFSVELKKVINERNILTTKTKTHVFKALDEIKIKNEEERRSYKRDKALLEIINSEITYVHQLEKIITFFMNPTRERKLLKPDDFDTLFGNINTIYMINKELLQELDKDCANVVKAFSKIAPYLKLYSVYAYGFKSCITVLQNARLFNPQFARFVENQESRPEVQNKLSALLITPIQRIPRYKLLLTNLYNLTRPSEKDFDSLSECLGKIEEAAEHINKIVEDQENMQRLLEFQRCLRSSEPNIITPGRKLLKEGILQKMPTNGTHSERIYVVLMSDIIEFCKMRNEELKINSLKCLSIFPLGKCKVVELLDKGCLQIICQEEEIIVYHEQFSETKKWITKIKEAIQNHLSDRKTLKKENSSRRPVKRRDIHEYHEVGLSPGRPLKKRKLEQEIEPTPLLTNTNKNVGYPLFYSPSISNNKNTYDDKLPDIKTKDYADHLYVFGKANDRGSIFGKFLGGIGGTIKKCLGFKK